jgi:hypothetical protein
LLAFKRVVIDIFLQLEPLVVGVVGFAFWYPAPPRDEWLWTLLLFIPVLLARWVRYGRLFTNTPLNTWLFVFLALMVINVFAAPYTRGIIMFSRPLFGMALYFSIVECARGQGNLNRVLHATVWLAGLVGFLSLTATQWNSKSAVFTPIIGALPRLQGFPGAEGGFNANEIAGALVWLQPLAAGIALYHWREREPYARSLIVFIMLTAGLALGQSRLALVGVMVALSFLALAVFNTTARRVLAALAILVVAGGLELAVFSNTHMTPDSSGLSARDEQSLAGRQDIWHSALEIIRDYPLTGVGTAMFRDGRVREQYPAPDYAGNILPHAHNEWLQVGADLGVPGLIVFGGWHFATAAMLVYSWRQGGVRQKILAASLAASLLAHGIFGLADAISLWDRFIFLYWWILGLVGAQFTVLKYSR